MTGQDGIDPATLAELRALLGKATSRPWKWWGDSVAGPGAGHDVLSAVPGDEPEDSPVLSVSDYDARLMVAAVNALGPLLAEAEAAQRMRGALAQVEALANPDIFGGTGMQPYAIEVGEEVFLGVTLEDLRAALGNWR